MKTLALTVAMVVGGVTLLVGPVLPAAVSPSVLGGNSIPLIVSATGGESLQKEMKRAVRHFLAETRQTGGILVRLYQDIAACWRGWLEGALFSLAVAAVAVLADRGLIRAWRADGLRSAATHSALMLYVYACLLFSGGVTLAPKLFFLAAVLYGMWEQDLVPDSRVEDVVFIVVAARAFIYACPEALLNEYASRAVAFRRRIASLHRSQ